MAGPLQPTATWLLPETLSAACDPTLGAHGTGCPGVAQIPGPCHCQCHTPPFGHLPDLTPCPGCGFSSAGVTAGCVQCCKRNPEQFAEMSSEMSAMGDDAREMVAALDPVVRAATHYVNCSDAEAETGQPYADLVHAVRTYQGQHR